MGKLLRKCVDCRRYTMTEDNCPECGGKTINPQPAKFSIIDKYGDYRRKLKKMNESSEKSS